jgi:hypothetical protein
MLILRELFGLVSALAAGAALGAADESARGFFPDTGCRGGSLLRAVSLGTGPGTDTIGWATGVCSGTGAGVVGATEATDFAALAGSFGSTAIGADCRSLKT